MKIDDLPDAKARLDALSAAHEAGHAIAFEVLQRPYLVVTLRDALGPPRIEAAPRALTREKDVEQAVVCALAGSTAEVVLFQTRSPMEKVIGASEDLAEVRRLLGPRARDRSLVAMLQEQTLELVADNIRQIKRVAKLLRVQRRLTRCEVRAAYEGLPLARPTWA